MARPVILYRLRNGVILLGKALVRFARTWNWLIDYVDNLKGDADLNAANGHIVVDRADPDHPVIRAVNLPQGGGGTRTDGKSVDYVPAADEGETPTGDEGKLQVRGYSDADVGTAPVKRQNGIVWEIVPLLTTATMPATCVLSTDAADVGTSTEAARADHVHKLPDTVVDTINTQTIGGAKTFTRVVHVASGLGDALLDGHSLSLKPATSDTTAYISILMPGSSGAVLVHLVADSATGDAFLRTGATRGGNLTLQAQGDGKNVVVSASGSGGMVILRAAANLSRLYNSPTATAAEVEADASGVGTAIASLAWVCGLQKTFVAGDGITFAVSEDGKTITISATNTGGATSGYTGTRNTLADQQYDTSSKRFQVKYHRETWVNGVMTACTTDTTWTTITGGQAVKETV
ncbi:MAG: hypothetical protein IJ173_02150 [Kiritimatiellae bacterium]|nr:hypothetical protein [Kiritimatiellia bacterium]